MKAVHLVHIQAKALADPEAVQYLAADVEAQTPLQLQRLQRLAEAEAGAVGVAEAGQEELQLWKLRLPQNFLELLRDFLWFIVRR